ncbi:MAG: BrnT family toxin [Methylococcaceae bacterium]
MKIEFDSRKAASNLKKHGVPFEEAASCLLDLNALAYEDNDATGENRWVLLGMSHQARLLVVIYTVRGESIRLISARKPTTKEANNYA